MSDEVAAFLAPGVSIHEGSFTDLTDVPVKRLRFASDGRLAVTFDGSLPNEACASVRRRMQSTSPAEETLLTNLADAGGVPATDLTAQVADLRSRVDMLTKLVLGETD